MIQKIYSLFPLLAFTVFCIPFIFFAGVTQDEGYLYGKCWVSRFENSSPIFSDYDCKPNTAVVRKILFIKTISQDLPPQYSVEIFGIRIPIHGWFHTGPIPYIIQNLSLFVGNKIASFTKQEDTKIKIRFISSKIPVFILGIVSLIFISLTGKKLELPVFTTLIFPSTLLAMIYNSSIGVAVVYLSSICFSSAAFYFLIVKNYMLFVLFSVLQILSYLPTFTFTVSATIGFLFISEQKKKEIIALLLSVFLGAFPYVLSSIDIETNPQTPPHWLGILPRSPIGSTKFLGHEQERVHWFLKDFINFFGYKGSGNSFIVSENYGLNLFYSLPFIMILLIFILYTSKTGKIVSILFSFILFCIFQLLLFPFPNHPRRFLYVLPIISLIPPVSLKLSKTRKAKVLALLLLVFHILGQAKLYKDAISKLKMGKFHISSNFIYQLELAKYMMSNGEDSFVNISGIFNFPIIFGKKSNIPDYIYLLSLYYFYARDEFPLLINKIISHHEDKKFILQRGEEELEIIRKSVESIGKTLKIEKKIPENSPIYYIVSFYERR